jgi:hypothetical protein
VLEAEKVYFYGAVFVLETTPELQESTNLTGRKDEGDICSMFNALVTKRNNICTRNHARIAGSINQEEKMRVTFVACSMH